MKVSAIFLRMHRLVELFADRARRLVVAVGAGAGHLLGVGGVRVFVVAFVMTLGAR